MGKTMTPSTAATRRQVDKLLEKLRPALYERAKSLSRGRVQESLGQRGKGVIGRVVQFVAMLVMPVVRVAHGFDRHMGRDYKLVADSSAKRGEEFEVAVVEFQRERSHPEGKRLRLRPELYCPDGWEPAGQRHAEALVPWQAAFPEEWKGGLLCPATAWEKDGSEIMPYLSKSLDDRWSVDFYSVPEPRHFADDYGEGFKILVVRKVVTPVV